MKGIELEYKLRILVNGEKVFGEGPLRLLEAVDRFTSLSKACQELNMSYSKGWLIIKRAEKVLDYQLLQSKIGGQSGGGSYLTTEARILMENYKSFKREAEESLFKLFNKYFKSLEALDIRKHGQG